MARPKCDQIAISFTAALARHTDLLSGTGTTRPSLRGGDGNGEGLAVAGVQEAAAGARRLPEGVA